MALSLKNVKRVSASQPPRVLIYAPPGLGKTTLGNEFPAPIFLQTEQGEGTGMELDTFGLLNSYTQLIEAVGALYSEEHQFQTVVLDSLDKLEPLLWAAVANDHKWDSIESPGYGKGYIAADGYWRNLIEGLNALRNDRGMGVVLLAHSAVERFDDPRTASYSRFDIRLHKRGQAIIEDEVDLIAFINFEATVKEEDQGFNRKRSHAEGGTQRFIYCEGRPSMNAKNRYGIPHKIPFKKGEGYAALSKFFPNVQQPAQTVQNEAAE